MIVEHEIVLNVLALKKFLGGNDFLFLFFRHAQIQHGPVR